MHALGTRTTSLILIVLALLIPAAPVLADDASGPPPFEDLDDLFADDIDDILNRSLANFQIEGPAPRFFNRHTLIEKTGYGNNFTAYPSTEDPYGDPNANEMTVEGRTTVEIFLPPNYDFSDTANAWMLMWTTPPHPPGTPENETTRLRRTFGRKAAERGVVTCLIFDEDRYPVTPGMPVPPIHDQFGYGENPFTSEGLNWMMRKDPAVTPLDIGDFKRMWRHFGIAKQYMYATTMAQRLISDTYGSQADAWVASVRTVLGGGSKGVGGVICAAGVDPRVGGVRYSGSQELNTDDTCSWHSYETQWGECPNGDHRRADFAKWAWENRNNSPSYFDLHAAGFDPDRYQDKLWLDVVGTADWSTPLASHYTFWDARDGLINGMVDPGEDQWNYRIVRRPNANHGVVYNVGLFGNFPVGCTDLLLWRTMRHLALGGELPRIDMVSADTTSPTSWTCRVRVTDNSTTGGEEYSVWVLLSDDLDTRRCSAPIENVPNGSCIDPVTDDNKPEEDFFQEIFPDSVTINGEFVDITFTPPAELAAFGPDPFIAMFAELVDRGPIPSLADDTWVHSSVITVNRSNYSTQSCP